MGNKAKILHDLIRSNELEFIMEAHNGLSAKIVQEGGFKGIWASGLSISASCGVRDSNELSWTQVLAILEFMSDNTSIPILLDGDTGYGNFNNMRRLVRKLEQIDIAGVCIEDKLFPKNNSLLDGAVQPLASIDEFCGKIKAAKDTQQNNCFSVVARCEAFIAGHGLQEALKRSEAYRQAGADAILIHSKRADSNEIELFMKEWANRHPVVIVPTKFYSTPTDKFRELGISLAIWANHNLRASISAMKKTTAQIFQDQSLMNIENKVASVSEVFRLQGEDELREAEKRYLPTFGKKVNAIILAAGKGKLGALTEETPTTLLRVDGKPILFHQVEEYKRLGFDEITVVRGHNKNKINDPNFHTLDNDEYLITKDLYSLFLAKEKIKNETVISYGDIVFKPYVLNELLTNPADIAIVVDAAFEVKDDQQDFVLTSEKFQRDFYSRAIELRKMSPDLDRKEVCGEFIGLWKVNEKGAIALRKALEELSIQDLKKLTLVDLFNHLVLTCPVRVLFIRGAWMDIDTIVDLQNAGEALQ